MNSLLLNKIARAVLLVGGIVGGIATAISCKNNYEAAQEQLLLENNMDEFENIIDVEYEEV